MPGGRKRFAIWSLYREIPASLEPKRCKKAVCNYCGREMMAQVARMRQHSEGCSRTPFIMKNFTGSGSDDTIIHDTKQSEGPVSTNTQQVTMSRYMKPLLSGEGLQHAHEHLVLALISGNIPWNFLENEHFIKFCKSLQPGINLPSREQASSTILSTLDNKVSVGIRNLVNGSNFLTLVTDTWTSSSNENFSSWIIINEKGTKELLAVEPSDPTKKSETIVQDITSKVKQLKDMKCFGKIQLNFVSDSASVYVKARRLLTQNSESGITLTAACLAHQSNLLVKDLMSVARVWEVIEKVVSVSSFVRRSIALRNSICKYLERDQVPMWLPSESRWYSFSFTLQHVLSIKMAIQVVFVEESSKPHLQSPTAKVVSSLIKNEDFWKGAEAVYHLLKPYQIITAISELDSASAGLFLMGWMWLKVEICDTQFLKSNERAQVIEKMKLRTKNFIEDHHLVAWMLDPRSRGCGLNKAGKRYLREVGIKLFFSLFPEKNYIPYANRLLEQWISYDSQTGIFSKESSIWLPFMVSKPFNFWCDVDEEAPELSLLAKAVLSSVPHTASCERLWSCAAATITKSRNRLSYTSIGKILRVKHHYLVKKSAENRAQQVLKKIKQVLCEEKIEPYEEEGDAGASHESNEETTLIEKVSVVLQGLESEDELGPQSEPYFDLLDCSDSNSPPRICNLLQYVASAQ